MPLPDSNRTAAAALFGAVMFALPQPKDEEKPASDDPPADDGDAEDYGTTVLDDDPNAGAGNPVAPRPLVNTVDAQPGQTWDEASQRQQQSFCEAVGFLRTYTSGQRKLEEVDKEAAAIALAAKMKDTPMAELKPNYGLMVSIGLSVLQSLRS